MATIKVRIPAADRFFYSAGNLSAAVKAKLVEALAQLAALPAPSSPAGSAPGETVAIYVSAEQEAALRALAGAHEIDGPGPAATALMHGWARSQRPSPPEPPKPATNNALSTLDRINQALGQTTRHDQARFYNGLQRSLKDHTPHSVIFAEASTGTGKTRAYLAAALDWCASHTRDDEAQSVVIALPSYNVLLQTLAQWRRVESVMTPPPWEVVAGQQEFVSAAALERMLTEKPDTPGAEKAQAWLKARGPAAPDDPIGHRWMMRSLRAATDFAFQLDAEVVLNADSSDSDEGMHAYHQQFTHAKTASILFCTHAMLAVDIRARTRHAMTAYHAATDMRAGEVAWASWGKLEAEARAKKKTWEIANDLLETMSDADAGRLPRIGLLIVDEAHLLEQSFAQVFASGASLTRLTRALRRLHEEAPRVISKDELAALEACRTKLMNYGDRHGIEPRRVDDQSPQLQSAVRGLTGLLSDILAKLPAKLKGSPEARYLRLTSQALTVAANAAGDRTGMTTRVSWSPSAHWPSIEAGRYDVSRELDFLWAIAVQDCSILVSATLFDDVTIAGLENTRRILSVRSSLVRALDPIRPAWLTDPVTLHLVGNTVHADGVERFRRPSRRDHLPPEDLIERTERWRQDVAQYVAEAYKSAAGGVLVLMTSHEERAELARRLSDLIPENCLIAQKIGTGVEAVRAQFLAITAAGHRPCLIGVGAAWTGLDISGDGLETVIGRTVPPGEDNVMTDLVIPVAPLGVNRSLTHEWRRERTGQIAEIGATALTFKQGIGRLVRREGLPHNRRLHFLDARIYNPKWNPQLRPILRELSRYSDRRTV